MIYSTILFIIIFGFFGYIILEKDKILKYIGFGSILYVSWYFCVNALCNKINTDYNGYIIKS